MATSNIVKGALISYISIFLNIAISFFYTPWMIKQIGVSEYGLYSLVLSFISYFIMDFGLSKAISRFIAKYRAENNIQMVSNMLGLTTRVYLIIDACIFLTLFILYFFIKDIFVSLTYEEIEKLKILYTIAGCFSVMSFMFRPMDGSMLAFEFFIETKSIDIINRVGSVILICIALYLGFGVYVLVLVNGVTALFSSILKFIIFKKKSKVTINWGYKNKEHLKEIFSFSMWAFGRGLAQRMRFSLVPSVLGIFCNTTEISLFAIGMTMEGMIFNISNAINGLFLPKISRISHANNRKQMNSLMIRVGRIELFIITFIFSAFLIFGKQFINLWLGNNFDDVYFIVLLLIFPNIIIFTQEAAENLVFVENKIRYTTTIIIICSALGLIGSIFVAESMGAIGCAMCSGIALFADTIIVNFYYHHKMNLNIPYFFKQCHLKNLPVYSSVAILTFLIKDLIQWNNWLSLILSVFIYFVIFTLVAYIFSFNKEEKQLVKDITKI